MMKHLKWAVCIFVITLCGCVPALVNYQMSDEHFRASKYDTYNYIAGPEGVSIQLFVHSNAKSKRLVGCDIKIEKDKYQSVSYDISQLKVTGNEGEYHVSAVWVDHQHHSRYYIVNLAKGESREIACAAWNDYAEVHSTEVTVHLGEILIPSENSSIAMGSVKLTLKE